MMENKETTSPPKAIDDNSEHVSKLVHQFYFVKLWPIDQDSICKIKVEENVVKKMNQDISEITESITKKMSEKEHLGSLLSRLNYPRREHIKQVAASKEKNFNSLMLHGNKSLIEEKRILRDINFLQKDVDPFKSLEVLKKTIRSSYYLKNWKQLLKEIEIFQIQYMERASGNDYVKGNISNFESLKKIMKDQIKVLCDESLRNRRELMEYGTRIRHGLKEVEGINGELCCLKGKLSEKNKLKGEAYQKILKLKKLYPEEILQYYQYCSDMNKVYQLVEEKDMGSLDEMSRSEVGKFMLEWNNNKAFREDYEKKVMQSMKRRQLSGDGRRKPDKS
ncbi:proton pump-interactor 1 isoform X2 [Lathyrus oleraceus]|uniref:Proton pump interactor n=1 Tax=Pisum sativum TaxID=3888 RepID=A0A9D5AN17_PEA|nr:proton pump-interactor 1-like isoform X2 [Pisum sativum]KAI5412959.1 hypothetical protein KIW84_057542 [Pisum sativum]